MDTLKLVTHHARIVSELANDRCINRDPRDRYHYEQQRRRALLSAQGDLKDACSAAREAGATNDEINAAQRRGGLD